MSIERGVKYLTQCDVLYCGRGDAKNFNVTTYRLLPKVVDDTSPTANKSFEYYIYMRHINVLQLHSALFMESDQFSIDRFIALTVIILF